MPDASFDFQAFPTLETERLLLREITEADIDAIFAIRRDYEVTKYNIGAAYTVPEHAAQLIRNIEQGYQMGLEVRWGIARKPDPTVIGMIGYNYWDQADHRGSVGFDLRRDHWRQGIMREALTTVIDFGFRQMALNRIEADCSIYNTASEKLLKSLGFRQEGHQREQYYEDGVYHDLLLFALLRREWAR